MADWITTGIMYLLPKPKDAKEPKNYWPINQTIIIYDSGPSTQLFIVHCYWSLLSQYVSMLEHIQATRTNKNKSKYAQHILDNKHT
jgi:hypothetical protein